MSCYKPNFMVPCGFTESGAVKYVFVHNDSVKKITVLQKEDDGKTEEVEIVNYEWLKETYPDAVQVPCGRCTGCRLDYARSWSDRMLCELDSFDGVASFVTLTYDNDHAHWSMFDDDGKPLYATLDKRDCQLFMKRLRKHFKGRRIRFFLSGEYGPSTFRPHMHAIIFGLGYKELCDPVNDFYKYNDLHQPLYKSPLLTETIWKQGFCSVTDVSPETCGYVARYVQKKLYGQDKILYDYRNVIPEFSLMSRNPGIGYYYLVDHPEVLDLVRFSVPTPRGGKEISIPKYFLRQLVREPKNGINPLYDPDKYDRICEERKAHAEESLKIKLSKTSLAPMDYLSNLERMKKKDIVSLRRNQI